MSASAHATVRSSQPGRLADPAMDPRSDPRTDPKLLAVLTEYGMDTAAPPPSITRDVSAEVLAEEVGQAHAAFEGLYETLPIELPGDADNVTHTLETIPGVDGNDITLHIHRPSDTEGPLPCIVYIHGGGMTILSTHNKVHRRWSQDLATTGMVVIEVDFRNAYTAAGPNPFPAGLNDCGSALAWIHAHREQLGITKIVLQGESGGANLVLATAMKAKRDGRLDSIDGVYATVPYISGGYGWDEARKLRELPSLVENNGYFATCEIMDLLVATYDPTGDNSENPLCWPYFADEADLRGLPPHVIAVNELDPLRDEGIAYHRKLARAGVPVVGRINLGITHAAELIFRQAVPEVRFATVRDIKTFADSLPVAAPV